MSTTFQKREEKWLSKITHTYGSKNSTISTFSSKKKERVITKQHEHPLAVKIEHFLIKLFSLAKELIYVN
jgi:hypothetical protein